MNIEVIVNEVDTKAYAKLSVVESLNNDINIAFKQKSYGGSIDNFLLICILVKTKPGYEDWFIPRRPRYIEHKLYKNKLTKQELEIKKQYTIELKFDYAIYDDFVINTDENSKKILAQKIFESFENLDRLPKKINDFDRVQFKEDMLSFLFSKGLIE